MWFFIFVVILFLISGILIIMDMHNRSEIKRLIGELYANVQRFCIFTYNEDDVNKDLLEQNRKILEELNKRRTKLRYNDILRMFGTDFVVLLQEFNRLERQIRISSSTSLITRKEITRRMGTLKVIHMHSIIKYIENY